tara:strand:- start:1059 stop:2483 length:1425 start_codon:yes stop_codon:yes gene_type:complete
MPLILPGNVGSATAATGFNVANSVRMNAADSAKMTIDFSGAGNQKKFTISCWVKRARITPDASQTILSNYADVNNFGNFTLNTSDKLSFVNRDGGTFNTNIATTRLFRDPSSFYHVVLSVDTTQSTDTNRIKMYVNGVQETLFSTSTYPDQNTDLKFNTTATTNFGSWSGSAQYADGYYSELVFIDNAQLAADQFGEFDDSGIWKPLESVADLTFGTNGFYLDFKDSANLGNDANGGTDLTEVNLAATDQSTDTCTNNFATLNPLHSIGASSELSQGNLEYDPSGHHRIISTIAPSSGKWYAEVKGIDNPDKFNAGVCYYPIPANGSISSFAFGQGINGDVGRWSNDFGIKANGDYGHDNSWSSYMASLEGENNNIVGIYMDLDNYKLYFSKNGSLVSSTGKDLTNNGYPYGFISVGEAATFQWNFGNPSFAISSGNTDDNGYGNFEYSPNITGDGAAKKFYSLNSKNLAEYGG